MTSLGVEHTTSMNERVSVGYGMRLSQLNYERSHIAKNIILSFTRRNFDLQFMKVKKCWCKSDFDLGPPDPKAGALRAYLFEIIIPIKKVISLPDCANRA